MQNEFEIKFLDIKEDELREKLSALSAQQLQGKKLMRRQTLDFPAGTVPDGQRKWARVRDEGDKITMTLKHIIDKTKIDGTKEVEVIVNDFDSACNIYVETGLQKASYQENYREEWTLEGSKITIDTWPGLKPFVEIESPSQYEAEQLSEKLGFNKANGVFGSIDLVYEKLLGLNPDTINKAPELTFENFSEVLHK